LKQINLQTPAKAEHLDDGSLLVHSIFLTIQGEGPNVGRPAIFVRLAECNLQCPGCDTTYTGDMVERLYFNDITRKIEDIQRWQCLVKPLIVITGGEPLRQNLVPLINWLIKHHYHVQIETNGTLGINTETLSRDARYDLEIVVSPKTNKVVESLHEFIIAYKYVVSENEIDDDGMPKTVLGLPTRPARPHTGYTGAVYIQPADEADPEANSRNLDAAIRACLMHGHTLCLQTHKIIGLA
jgi:organic radical activating enzyme